MARRRTTSESKQARGEQTAGRGTISTNSWWKERWRIKVPRPEDQERHYREEQERFEQGRLTKVESGEKVEDKERKDIFRIWADSYGAISRIWEDSYVNLYKPWIESTGEMYSKMAELSKDAKPENYKSLYDEWVKTYQNGIGRFYPVQIQKSDREALEKFMLSAEESKDLIQSWITMLDETSNKTRELFQSIPDPKEYKQFYDIWISTYGKIFEGLLSLPTMEHTGEAFENYTGIHGIYLRSFAQISKIWRDSFTMLYWPLTDSMMRLYEKTTELSRGEVKPETYREFYDIWIDVYKDIFSRLFNVQSVSPATKDLLDSFLRSTDIYLSIYRSWMTALEKMSENTIDVSKRTTEPEIYRGFYSSWVQMYNKAFDDLFRYMPVARPMQNIMEPVKSAAKIYTDMFANISDMWLKSVFSSTTR